LAVSFSSVHRSALFALLPVVSGLCAAEARAGTNPIATSYATEIVDVSSLRGKVLCGYQGWFRCPGDAANMGWIHWSRDLKRVTRDSITFEMWPDLSDYAAPERYPVSGFTYPDGRPAELFSSDNAATVLRHFEWMRNYGLDGAWLQHFLVDLPGGPQPNRYPSRRRVLDHVRNAAQKTGRAWGLSYDIAGMPTDRIFGVLTADRKKMVEEQVTKDSRYLHHEGKPVVQIWGFYFENRQNSMTTALANQLIDVAMFDEVDEGTAIFRVTSSPPTQAHFVGYDGLPSDWYLRLVGEGARMLRENRQIPAEIPIKP